MASSLYLAVDQISDQLSPDIVDCQFDPSTLFQRKVNLQSSVSLVSGGTEGIGINPAKSCNEEVYLLTSRGLLLRGKTEDLRPVSHTAAITGSNSPVEGLFIIELRHLIFRLFQGERREEIFLES